MSDVGDVDKLTNISSERSGGIRHIRIRPSIEIISALPSDPGAKQKKKTTETLTGKDFKENLGDLGSVQQTRLILNLVCIGHTLLQHEAIVDRNFLNKYNLELGYVYIRPRDEVFLSDLMKCVTGAATCGGDAIKIAEAAQWITLNPKSVAFLGTSGGDFQLNDTVHSLHAMNLAFKLEINAKASTSLQFVLRCGKRWSEVFVFDPKKTSLTMQFIDRPRVTHLLERSEIIFLSGSSYLLMNMDLEKFAYFTSSRLKILFIQISDGVFKEGMEKSLLNIIKYTDFLFISVKTALDLVHVFNLELPGFWCMCSSGHRIVQAIHHWVKSHSNKACTVVMYDEIRLAFVASDLSRLSHCQVKKYTSKFYTARNVIDLYGCENAFAGGFAAQFLQTHDIKSCINCAFFCASAVATQMGAHFPPNRHDLISMWEILNSK